MAVAELIVTPDEVLHRGLELVGFTKEQLSGVMKKKNLSRFRSHFTNNPLVYAILFHQLQVADDPRANILRFMSKVGPQKTFDYFFCGIHLLACYPTEEEAEAIFNHCNVTWSNWAWDMITCISHLMDEYVKFPDNWSNPDTDNESEAIFVMTVDGVHCPIEEPPHKLFSENKKYFSHKHHGAGLDYELGIATFTQHCVWVGGPYPAGTNDITVFRAELKPAMEETRNRSGVDHRILADRGYRGERDFISTPSSHDSEDLRYFKGRALSRHETFNGRLKNFDSLQERFRHSIAKHNLCFRAGVVIVQISLENGCPLFEV